MTYVSEKPPSVFDINLSDSLREHDIVRLMYNNEIVACYILQNDDKSPVKKLKLTETMMFRE